MDDIEKETRVKRLIYRANHRGIKEMDIILGRFATDHLPSMDDETIDAFEMLMSEHDRDLLTWFTGEVPFPLSDLETIFNEVRAYTIDSHQNG